MMGFGGRTPSEMIPLPFISISRLLRACRRHGVAGADVARPDHASHDDIFVLVIHEDLPLCFHDKVSVGKNGNDLAGKVGREGGIGRRRSLPLQHR